MKIKEWIEEIGNLIGLFLSVVMVIIIAVFSPFIFPSFEEKKKGIFKLQKCDVYCGNCGKPMFLELVEKEPLIDDWDWNSDRRFCLNQKCPNYGKPLIIIYDPLTSAPDTLKIRRRDKALLIKDDPRITIVN